MPLLRAPEDGSEPIHEYFSLSYANYLVLHRTLMQSIPVEWQQRFVACLEELERAFDHVEKAPGYEVKPARDKYVEDLTQEELDTLDITVERIDCDGRMHERSVYYDRTGNELEPYSHVMVPIEDDPVPHYDRGRARVEPKLRK